VGAFYLQEPSAMLPVSAANIPENAMALDLCAAPGGKSIMLAKRLKNGHLISNEINFSRAKILYSNIERMGLKNVAITNNAPKDFTKFNEYFDVILVDAPCSGEGMFRKDEEAVAMWSQSSVKGCASRQVEILDCIAGCVKSGGLLIYSTCTFSKEENEDVVEQFLNKYPEYYLEQPNCVIDSFTTDGICMPKCRRAYPHISGGEGQFFALLRKRCNDFEHTLCQNRVKVNDKNQKNKQVEKNNIVKNFLNSVGIELKTKTENGKVYSGFPADLNGLRVVSDGVHIGDIDGKIFKPSHYFFTAYGLELKNKFDLNEQQVERYLRGEEFDFDGNNGYYAVTYSGLTLGGGKVSEGRLRNLYPKGLRNFK